MVKKFIDRKFLHSQPELFPSSCKKTLQASVSSGSYQWLSQHPVFLSFWITSTLKCNNWEVQSELAWMGVPVFIYMDTRELMISKLSLLFRQDYCSRHYWHTMYWGVGREKLLQAAPRLLFKLIASSLLLQDHAQQFMQSFCDGY